MAAVSIATATAAPLSLLRPSVTPTRMSSVTRAALAVLAGHVVSIARPIAIAVFAHAYGADTLGSFMFVLACVELGSRLATIGLDRGVQRWEDHRRLAAASAGMVIAGGFAVTFGIALAAVAPQLISSDSIVAAQLALVLALPVSAIGNVALRATRGNSQVVTFVLARSVTEPLLFLTAGLLLRSRCDGSVALPVALMVSVAGGTAVAAFGLVRSYGVRELVAALRRVKEWPVRELVHTSVPLGIADVLQTAQSRLDLIAVALVTFSPMAIASYAIATEIASVFVAVRIAVDQVVAPLAVDARRNRIQLRRLVSIGSRWTSAIAVVLAFLVLAAPNQLLKLFGGSEQAVLVLFVLVLGRAVELALSPAASTLAMVGEPKLSLLAAATGLAFATSGQIVATIVGMTPVAIAVASAGGVAIAGVLAAYLLTATVRTHAASLVIGGPQPSVDKA